MRKVFLFSIGIIASSFVFIRCDNPTNPDENMPTNGKNIQVVYPAGGESFTVGQTVTIQFKINANKISSAMPQISLDSGKSYYDIPGQAVYAKSGGGGQLLTCSWTIGQEVNPLDYVTVSPGCRIKVYNYEIPTEFDTSPLFTVSP